MRFRLQRFFLHKHYALFFVQTDHPRFLQSRQRFLAMAHNATCLLFFSKRYEPAEREIHHIICRQYQHIILNIPLPNRQQQIVYRPYTMFIILRAIIYQRNGMHIMRTIAPLLKDMYKAMVCDYNMFIYTLYSIHIRHQPIKNGFPTHIKQRFREILRQRI